MNSCAKNLASAAALSLAAAVALGAFGAHALRTRLEPYDLAIWDKAVFYHFIHSLGALVILLNLDKLGQSSVILKCAGALLLGCLLFSGSLYLLALTHIHWLGAITPLGGLLFIGSWIALGLKLRG